MTAIDYPQVKAFLVEYNELATKLDGAIAGLQDKQEVEAQARLIKSKIGFLSRALDSKNIPHVMRMSEELKELMQPLLEKFASHEDAKPVLEESQGLLDRVEAESGPIIREQEATELVQSARSFLNALTRALSSKDDARVAEYREKLEPMADQLREKYAEENVAKDFLAEVDSVLARVEDELGSIIAEKEISRISYTGNGALRWLESALDKKDSRMAQQHVPRIEEAVAALRRYESFEAAKTLLATYTAALARVDSELGDIIASEEIKIASQAISSPLRALNSALDDKNVPRVIQMQERVVELAAPLRKYANNAEAKPFLQDVEAALGRVKGEVFFLPFPGSQFSPLLLGSFLLIRRWRRSSQEWLWIALKSR